MNLYRISFPNGKFYVGVESKSSNRWRAHCHPDGSRKISFVAQAIRKYGKENCRFEYLAKDVDQKWCLRLERAFIRMMNLTDKNFGYNISIGGEVGPVGSTHTPEWKLAMSKRLKGKKLSKEHCQAISEGQKGKVYSQETREKISASTKLAYQNDPTLAARCTAACHTPEAWAKISAANNGHIHAEDHKRKISDGLKHAYRSGKRMAVQNNWTPQQKIEISERLKLAYANGNRKSRKGVPRSHSLS